VKRLSGVIKVGQAQLLLRECTLIKVENVLWKRISMIDLNHFWRIILVNVHCLSGITLKLLKNHVCLSVCLSACL
jgi:hypothetical protein